MLPQLWLTPPPWGANGQANSPDARPGAPCPADGPPHADQLSAVLFRAQDVAPKGGYAPVRTGRNLPKGGASALVMATASVFVFGWGMYKIIKANQTRRCAPPPRP